MDDIVLLVEDNLDHAVLVQALLDYHGIGDSVTVAQTLSEAKSYLLGEWPFHEPERHPRPDLIILDHWLDDGTGLDLLEWLGGQARFRDIPVIVFTGCTDPEVRRRALALGAKEFLLKPGGYESLGRSIEALVRRGSLDDDSDGEDSLSSAHAG